VPALTRRQYLGRTAYFCRQGGEDTSESPDIDASAPERVNVRGRVELFDVMKEERPTAAEDPSVRIQLLVPFAVQLDLRPTRLIRIVNHLVEVASDSREHGYIAA
jgi:hypothetical protein